MIYEVLNRLETVLKDGGAGINAEITALNTAKSTACPQVREFLTWDRGKLPDEMMMPTFLQVWEDSWDLKLTSQSKFRGKHRVTWQYWTQEHAAGQSQKDLCIMAHAYRKVVELAEGGGTVEMIDDVAFHVTGWKMSGHLYSVLEMIFVVTERDEDP